MSSQPERFRYADNRQDSHLRAQHARQLRTEVFPPEKILWSRLRNRQLGDLKFRRQHPIGPFVVDFFCEQLRLAIEVDGRIHDNQIEYDKNRDQYLASQGIIVKRFTASDVTARTEGVLKTILETAQSLESEESKALTPPSPRGRGSHP